MFKYDSQHKVIKVGDYEVHTYEVPSLSPSKKTTIPKTVSFIVNPDGLVFVCNYYSREEADKFINDMKQQEIMDSQIDLVIGEPLPEELRPYIKDYTGRFYKNPGAVGVYADYSMVKGPQEEITTTKDYVSVSELSNRTQQVETKGSSAKR